MTGLNPYQLATFLITDACEQVGKEKHIDIKINPDLDKELDQVAGRWELHYNPSSFEVGQPFAATLLHRGPRHQFVTEREVALDTNQVAEPEEHEAFTARLLDAVDEINERRRQQP